MKRTLSLLLALLLTFPLAACSARVDPAGPAEPKPEKPADSALHYALGHPLTAEGEYMADDGTMLLTTKYELPQLELRTADGALYLPSAATANVIGEQPHEVAVRDAFNAEMKQTADALESSAQEVLEMARGYYASLRAEQRMYWLPYAEELTAGDIYQTDGMISFRGSGYANYGGAHPSSYTRTWTFDLTRGEFLSFDTLDAGGSQNDALGETLTHTLAMAVLQEIDTQGLSKDYYEDYAAYIFDLAANANFFFDAAGMNILFDVYVIAPYAAGPQEFHIP